MANLEIVPMFPMFFFLTIHDFKSCTLKLASNK